MTSPAAAARALHDAALSGDFRGRDRVLAALRSDPSDEARAWALALEAQGALADPRLGAVPGVAALASLRGAAPEARAAAAVACVHAERAALLAFDWEGLSALVAVHAELAPASDGWLGLARGLALVVEGRASEGIELAHLARSRAAELSDAALVLEASAVAALGAAVAGDLEEATRLARRASRMARTEALPQQEYLVNLILARVRRLNGSPHLATRILHALLRVAPAPWRAWLSWERTLSEGPLDDTALGSSGGRSAEAVVLLHQMLDAAQRSDRAAFEGAAFVLADLVAPSSLHSRDIALLHACMDASLEVAADHPALPWLSGAVDAVPDGLHGVCGGVRGEAAFVLARPGAPGRRVLAISAALTEASALPETPGRRARTESTLAALALAPPEGMEETALFETVYGFAYRPSLHAGVRDVLYHRVRKHAEGHGVIERDGGVVRARFDAPALVADPRSSPPPDSEVLRVLARLGHASAKAASEALGLPLNTVRQILNRLADEGACRVEKDGRRLEYFLDDTTFSEPTAQA